MFSIRAASARNQQNKRIGPKPGPKHTLHKSAGKSSNHCPKTHIKWLQNGFPESAFLGPEKKREPRRRADGGHKEARRRAGEGQEEARKNV